MKFELFLQRLAKSSFFVEVVSIYLLPMNKHFSPIGRGVKFKT